ncbi:S8 family serine peptidase [Streptomyces sp. NPDC086077]|uniref:S8 family serine peptidase n=1 Tax=Streptomyces sp. NPDC086077 TaxID=3154862 RepID=UPI00341A7CAA
MPVSVTLITGDKVKATQGPSGAVSVDDVQRAAGAKGSVRVAVENGDTYVYPDEAMPYIATGRLDRQLFNVTQLVTQGYDDARIGALPLIVIQSGSATARKSDTLSSGTALPGAKTTLALPSLNGAAVEAQRSKAATFWSALTDTGQNAASRSAARTAGSADDAGGPSFAAGIDEVWLDAKAKATMAETNAQIGTPEAWKAGGTGEGVRVAVLDTGVDATHPDLVNRIVASRSFVEGQEVADRNGHGTHTASTVAGTGAASGGKEQGVAPGADLIVGKVLGDNNSGYISGIVAGMEWAARTEHAKVINMSLGTPTWHTQDDPLSQAVNKLTAKTGALFVIAAGNAGNSPYTVSAPGTADAALTVGAVDSSDALAPFSSVGPRLKGDGLKPDLTAPGVEVLAASSQQVEGAEGFYRTESGTSMAAPHVAGAAVLLAQKHPEWSGRQIKDALMSTSALTPAYTPYQAGAGRLDVAAAYLKDQVIATGSVDAGLVRWTKDQKRNPVERKITYTNTTNSCHVAARGGPRCLARWAVHPGRRPRHGPGPQHLFGRGRRGPEGARGGPVRRPGHRAFRGRRRAHGPGNVRRVREVRPDGPSEGQGRQARQRRGRDYRRRRDDHRHVGSGRQTHQPLGPRLLHRRLHDGCRRPQRPALPGLRRPHRARGGPQGRPGGGSGRVAYPPGQGGHTQAHGRDHQPDRPVPLLHL